MSDRRDTISPVDRMDPIARVNAARERAETLRRTVESKSDQPTEKEPPSIETYRVVIDPDTLRAVTEVRDPQTGAVRFVVPTTADYDQKNGPQSSAQKSAEGES